MIELEPEEFLSWTWDDMESRYREIEAMPVDGDSVAPFLQAWTALSSRILEIGTRLRLATDGNTADEEIAARYRSFVEDIVPRYEETEQRLNRRLLAAHSVPPGMDVPLRAIRVDAELYREANLPLMTDERLAADEYSKITGAQTVRWDGEEIPLVQLGPVYEEQDRDRRERAFRVASARRLQDRDAIHALWVHLLDVRERMARNADFPNYLEYRWRALRRFDYTPEDAQTFHRAVERVVVPAVSRLHERRRQRLGLPSLRPWDREVDVFGRGPLQPYGTVAELEDTTAAIVRRVDPVLGGHFDTMRRLGLLDMESRTNKAPGAYCTILDASVRPFIFGNASGTHDDIVALLHEGGHAMHVFESAHLPYLQQRSFGTLPAEFAEVASMSMELLAAPYLTREEGGFYSVGDAARARIQHLEAIITLLPWTVVVDAFQHWAYRHPQEARDLDAIESVWADLIARYMPDVDYSGLERERNNDWQRIPHLFGWPLYFIEYALAQLGAIQIWANARRDQAAAVQRYRAALALGSTATVPELFHAAGAEFAFDEQTLRSAVHLVEGTITELEAVEA